MKDIKPQLGKLDVLYAETTALPTGIVVFGASGDLAHRKLLVSLFELFRNDLMDQRFYMIGCGRSKLSDDDIRDSVQKAIRQKIENYDAKKLDVFLSRLFFLTGDYDDEKLYQAIRHKLTENDKAFSVPGHHVFYLSVPPLLYSVIVSHLGQAELADHSDSDHPPKLVIEKPFGHDLDSAVELNRITHKWFDESQIYRIDHYMGKETVQNILMFRFANTIFEPFWNRNYIDHVQITIAESLGIEHRAGYYEKSGAMRDMFQNHMLGMLALVAMEPPSEFEADCVRDEKVKLLHCIRPFNLQPWSTTVARGQYGAGKIDGQEVIGYRQEEKVDPNSTTETYVAAKVFIDNWRWQDVPFYLRTGKRLPAKDTEIAITFKKIPHSMFAAVGLDEMPQNVLVFQIQPQEGISLQFQAKRPGSKICMGTLNMQFNYCEIFGAESPEAYQRLLLDCMTGDQMLFPRQDDVETSWKLLMPVLEAWQGEDSMPYEYPAGAQSFAAADELIAADGRSWRPIG